MKKAVLYIRVSTDEQRDTGYSLQDQEIRLRRECERVGYNVVEVIQEDYSAKTFKRPAYQKFISDIKSKKLKTDIFFCTKADRFSRNLLEAFKQKKWLEQNDILLKFLEGDIDSDDPNAILMQAFAFAMPEVENQNRSRNVTRGMRQAMKEGRYVNRAPIGYSNSNGTIIPNDDASFVTKAFYEVLKGIEPAEVIRKKLLSEGFKGCERNNFHKMLRNKLYCGLIHIKSYKGEPEEIVKGSHEILISEQVFNDVQEILMGRGKKSNKYNKFNEALPLRGLLTCTCCGESLTGSTSKNKLGKPYTYYHCQKGCTRVRDTYVDQQILSTLSEIQVSSEVINLYLKVIEDLLKDDDLGIKVKIKDHENSIMDIPLHSTPRFRYKVRHRFQSIVRQHSAGKVTDYSAAKYTNC